MIFNNDLIFIHIGKTGGTSCARYLLHNLKTPVYNCHHGAFAQIKALKIDGIVPKEDINRHCTLTETLDYIRQFNGKQLKDFAKVVAVIRHPYTLEYSYYKHLQKPHVKKRRKDDIRLLELAGGNFKTFVGKADYHRRNHTQDDFVRVGNEIPDCVELIRFEQLAVAFPEAVSRFCRKEGKYPFPHANHTEYQSNINNELTDDVKELIYQKHKFMFDSGLYSTNYIPPDNHTYSDNKKRRSLRSLRSLLSLLSSAGDVKR